MDSAMGTTRREVSCKRPPLAGAESGQRHAVAAPLEMPWDHFERSGLVFPVQDHGPPWARRWFCSPR
jgi:hypothetical protein